MANFDLLSDQPSTAQLMMGARSRGPASARDPRAVDIDFDFDPDAPLPTSSLSTKGIAATLQAQPAATNASKASATSADAVDGDELKRRIKGSGSAASLADSLRSQAAEVGAKVASCCLEQAKAKPRLALGSIVAVTIIVMFGSIWVMAQKAVPEEALVPSAEKEKGGYGMGATSSKSAKLASDDVAVEVEGESKAVSEREKEKGEDEEEEEKEKVAEDTPRASKLGRSDGKSSFLMAVRAENQGLKTELKGLRRDVREMKELLESSLKYLRASAASDDAGAKDVQTERKAGNEDEPAIKLEEDKPAPLVQRARSSASSEKVQGEELGDPGEIRVEKPEAGSGLRQPSGSEPSGSSGWSNVFAR